MLSFAKWIMAKALRGRLVQNYLLLIILLWLHLSLVLSFCFVRLDTVCATGSVFVTLSPPGSIGEVA